MTLMDAYHSRAVSLAANRAARKFRFVPGCHVDAEDFRQEAALALMRGPLPRNKRLLYVIALRRMIDFGRSQMAITRSEHRQVAVGDVPAAKFAAMHDPEITSRAYFEAWGDYCFQLRARSAECRYTNYLRRRK